MLGGESFTESDNAHSVEAHLRIEDDAIVTAQGCELITRGVPVKADEIEALMR